MRQSEYYISIKLVGVGELLAALSHENCSPTRALLQERVGAMDRVDSATAVRAFFPVPSIPAHSPTLCAAPVQVNQSGEQEEEATSPPSLAHPPTHPCTPIHPARPDACIHPPIPAHPPVPFLAAS